MDMPKWPHPGMYGGHRDLSDNALWFSVQSQEVLYERARADCAMERLRVAVEALKAIGEYYLAPRGDVSKALKDIGELPE